LTVDLSKVLHPFTHHALDINFFNRVYWLIFLPRVDQNFVLCYCHVLAFTSWDFDGILWNHLVIKFKLDVLFIWNSWLPPYCDMWILDYPHIETCEFLITTIETCEFLITTIETCELLITTILRHVNSWLPPLRHVNSWLPPLRHVNSWLPPLRHVNSWLPPYWDMWILD
jgi:hypothetical protein